MKLVATSCSLILLVSGVYTARNGPLAPELAPSPTPEATGAPLAELFPSTTNIFNGLAPLPEPFVEEILAIESEAQALSQALAPGPELSPAAEDIVLESLDYLAALPTLGLAPLNFTGDVAGSNRTVAFVDANCTAGSGGAFAIGRLTATGSGTFAAVTGPTLLNATSANSTITGFNGTFVSPGMGAVSCTVVNGTVLPLLPSTANASAGSNFTLSWNGTVSSIGPASYLTPNGTITTEGGNSSYVGALSVNVFYIGQLATALGSGFVINATAPFSASGALITCTGIGSFTTAVPKNPGPSVVTGDFAASGEGWVEDFAPGGSLNGTGLFYPVGTGGECVERPDMAATSMVIEANS